MLAKAPLLRIVIPFIAGILMAGWREIDLPLAIAAAAAIAVAVHATPLILRGKPLLSLKCVPALGAMVMAMATIAGWLAGSAAKPQPLDLPLINGQTIIARIDAIEHKNFSTQLEATILSCPQNRAALPHKAQVSISIKANDYLLQEGELLSFQALLEPITSLGNPDEFDYARYMRNKGIIYIQTLEPDSYDTVGYNDNIFTLSRRAQRHISNCIINSQMAPGTQRFLCTILLGNSAYMESETRAYFSQAGISHILALSGLHISIIVGILFLLLKPLCYVGLHKLRIAIAIPAIVAYLLVTGMMPSATRSVVMVLFVLVAHLLHRRNSSLNALLAAALFILAVSPGSIYDVGFQLSFAAVLAILVFYDRLVTVSPRRATLYYWVSSLMLTTIATFGTTIISAYYFHTIPLLAIVSNMIVLPALPFYLCFALLHTTLLCCGIEIVEFSQALDFATKAIDYVAAGISRLPFSAMTSVHISPTVLALFLVLYAALAAWLYNKHFRYAIASLAITLAIAIACLIEYASTPQSGFVIQNSYASTPILHFSHGTCRVWCPDDSIDIEQFSRYNSGFLSHYGLHKIALHNDTLPHHQEGCYINPPFACLNGYRLAVISETKWRHYHARRPVYVDYLVIASSYYGNIADLLDTFAPRTIVLSGGIYEDKTSRLMKGTDTISLPPIHHLRTDGAIFVTGWSPSGHEPSSLP